MKSRIWIALPLAVMLIVPAVAQEPTPTTESSAAQSGSTRQPLQLEDRQGFWGKLNPFARKKYVQRQLSPVVDRTNELDELTKANAKSISDVDARAQEGIKMASAKATEANTNAVNAGNRAQTAQKTASDANTRLETVQQIVTNLDQYKPNTQVEIRFRRGQTALSDEAKAALDELAGQLKDQKGYVIEVRGLTTSRGTAGIESSERMAESVARYLVVNYDVPLYRMRVLGVGNIASQAGETSASNQGPRVEISLLKNDLEQLTSMQPLQAPAPQQ